MREMAEKSARTPNRMRFGNALKPPLSGDFGGLRRPLLEWFEIHRREMPWRGSVEPYLVWVSEIMLQQTQVATVTPYFDRFVASLPTLQDLAQADEQTVLNLWSGLGYYSRARNLRAAAQQIEQEHGGTFPEELEAVRALPGIGDYTAGAILSIVFEQPVPAVDGNVERVLSRICEIEGPPKKSPAKGQIREVASELVRCERPGDLNQSLMELGAMLCTPTSPRCAKCPVNDLCRAKARGRQSELPQVPKRQKAVERRTAAAIIRRGDCVLIAQRPPGQIWAGLWEFPQAEADEGDPREALRDHVKRRLGVDVAPGTLTVRVRHSVTNQAITLDAYECDMLAGELVVDGYAAAVWAPIEDLAQYPLSSPHKKIARTLNDTEGRLPL